LLRFATLALRDGSAVSELGTFLMSEKIKILLYGLWIAHPVLSTGIAITMYRRAQHRAFKYFFAYIVAQILSFAVVFPTYLYNEPVYFYVSSCSTAISVVLGFLVIYEAFLDIFRPFHTLKDLGAVLFRWAGLVMLLVAGVVSVSNNSADTAPWVQAITTAQRCVRIIQVGMVLFLLFFARYLGVSRRRHSFGISLGFGIFALVELALVASWTGYRIGYVAMSIVNMVSYNSALFIWWGYMIAKIPASDTGSGLLRPQRWEQGLSDIHHPLPADSLIPMFEDMVDRALSRTPVSPIASEESQELASPAVPREGLGASALSAKAGSRTLG
jgi:hypothetical protein